VGSQQLTASAMARPAAKQLQNKKHGNLCNNNNNIIIIINYIFNTPKDEVAGCESKRLLPSAQVLSRHLLPDHEHLSQERVGV
jgi:hypothetical protein